MAGLIVEWARGRASKVNNKKKGSKLECDMQQLKRLRDTHAKKNEDNEQQRDSEAPASSLEPFLIQRGLSKREKIDQSASGRSQPPSARHNQIGSGFDSMTPGASHPRDDPTKVALFVTSSTPFSDEWIKEQCDIAERSAECSDGLDERIRLERIPGDFAGWTPFKLARDYVFPRLFEQRSQFAYISFVVLDDQSHDDRLMMIVGVHPDSYKGMQLEIEGTLRLEAYYAVNLPIVFHEGIQGILAYM